MVARDNADEMGIVARALDVVGLLLELLHRLDQHAGGVRKHVVPLG